MVKGNKMSDEENVVTLEQLQASVEDLTSQLGKVNSKNNELLSEKKKAQQAAKDSAEAADDANDEKLRANNDFEQLLKSTTEKLEKSEERNLNNERREASKEVNLNALRLAGKIADGDNAEILAGLVAKRLRFADGELKVLNKDGELTISTLDDLQKEFSSDIRFISLLKGNKSSGGGANGGSNGNGVTKNKLTSTQRIAEGLKEL